jgi:hypothetical protein
MNNNIDLLAREDSDDEEDLAAALIVQAATVVCDFLVEPSARPEKKRKEKEDHRTGPRKKRRKFNHDRALENIQEDYLCADPLLGKEFPLMFAQAHKGALPGAHGGCNGNKKLLLQWGHFCQQCCSTKLGSKVAVAPEVSLLWCSSPCFY